MGSRVPAWPRRAPPTGGGTGHHVVRSPAPGLVHQQEAVSHEPPRAPRHHGAKSARVLNPAAL